MPTVSRWPELWSPLTIGPTRVSHRIMASAHAQLYADDGLISQRHIDYYAERARGGCALLVLEQQAAHPAGHNYLGGSNAYERRVIPRYEALANAVHAHDGRIFVQLFASGAQGKGMLHIDDWRPLWASSAMPSAFSSETPMEVGEAEIREVIDGFARSAENAAVAGTDGVEIHGAHAQFVGEFLSPSFNRRTDAYGGSVENRCRLLLQIGDAIRNRVGNRITVGVRLSFDEFIGEAGITGEDASAQLEILAASGLFDYFSITGGGYHALHIAVAPMGSLPEGFMADFGRQAKAVVGDRARVFIVGRILSGDTANRIIADGWADMVAMTRTQLADPELVNKLRQGRPEEIRRCVGANICIKHQLDQQGVICALNPAAGREAEWGAGRLRPVRAGQDKRIAVIGAGPAGMTAAARLAERGHRVTLFEAEEECGGRLALLRRLPGRENWGMAVEDMQQAAERAGVTLRLATRVTADTLSGGDWDTVVCATGARFERSGYSPSRPDRFTLPGADADHVTDVETALRDALEDPAVFGQRTLIIDETGEHLPFCLAELLAGAGCQVQLVTPKLFAGEGLLKTLDLPHVLPRLQQLGVVIRGQTFVERITGGGAEIYGIWGGKPEPVAADRVVLALGRRSNDVLYRELEETRQGNLHRIGDCVAPRAIEAVIYEGERLGRELA
ncbi:FAD-dependent oxidoreductase [Methylonatrum kenyense]|uniref:FAD-dependent oxidoreductase n=1 Tax=Methylonatrum kenyense TaxID=455253 RepID=UPI0020C11449|nr:FAD-dependent oxidoreductase [Methylonatrum kenyense]MCK8514929.1 FAD-dependent oxidoreductase [Methylonatrum kenyense]